MEIRLLLPGDDRREVSRVYEESWRFAYRGIIPQAYLDGIPAGHWAPCLDTPGWHTLLCMENGAMVGTSSFCASRSAQFPGWGEIISLYLLPAYMGRGYGKALLLNALAELDRLGFGEVFLWVLEENRQARQFYSRMGFSPSGGFLEDSIGGKPLRELAYAYKISAWFIRPRPREASWSGRSCAYIRRALARAGGITAWRPRPGAGWLARYGAASWRAMAM